ncbi:hypothetical protein GC170_21395 [bacterium]|nr:hypothetical protein [bacterium]
MRAISEVLKDENLVYVNSTIDFGRTQSLNGQRVRLPRESLRHKTANYLGGALLFASLMEANSLNPGLVFVPGHALVAWQKLLVDLEDDTDTDLPKNWDFLERTMLISNDSFGCSIAKRGKRKTRLAIARRGLSEVVRSPKNRFQKLVFGSPFPNGIHARFYLSTSSSDECTDVLSYPSCREVGNAHTVTS